MDDMMTLESSMIMMVEYDYDVIFDNDDAGDESEDGGEFDDDSNFWEDDCNNDDHDNDNNDGVEEGHCYDDWW